MLTERRIYRPVSCAVIVTAMWIVSSAALAGKPGGGGGSPPDITFDVQLLGTLGGYHADARALNNSGTIVGRVDTGDAVIRETAFMCSPTGGTFDLNLLLNDNQRAQWHLDFAEDINDAGQVLGFGPYDPDGPTGPLTRWGRTGFRLTRFPNGTVDIVPLGMLVPMGETTSVFKSPEPAAMNSSGDVVAWYTDDIGLFNAGLWPAGGGFVALGNLNGGNTFPSAISDRDANGYVRIVGEAGALVRAWQAVIQPVAGATTILQDLGVPYASSSSVSLARAVNNKGEIVGEATFANGNNFGFLYSQTAGWQNLGTLANPKSKSWNNSWAVYINNNSWVIGGSMTGNVRDNPNNKGFLYRPGIGMKDLEAMVNNMPAGLGSGRLAIADINDNNVMCGSQSGVAGGNQVYLLVPKNP